jgi:predicted Rossmann-fold nucleotide-binding protein
MIAREGEVEMTLTVLVCGGRLYSNVTKVGQEMRRIERERGEITLVIHGGAQGADSLAKFWAQAHHKRQWEFRAQWKKYGMRAGPLRNQKMLDEGRPDLVVAFPGGRGTADMVARARKAGVEVIEVSE